VRQRIRPRPKNRVGAAVGDSIGAVESGLGGGDGIRTGAGGAGGGAESLEYWGGGAGDE